MRFISLLAPFALVASVGCGDGGPVEDIKNCSDVCGNYETCEDSTFDQTECVNRCEGRADYDDAFRAALADCEACIDQGSCAEDAAACAEDCDEVINGST